MLVLTEVLPREAIDVHAPATAAALFTDAGDEAGRCRASVAAGWSASPVEPVDRCSAAVPSGTARSA